MCAATSHQLRRRQLYTAPSVCSAARAPCTKQARACNSGGSRTRNSGVSLLRRSLMKRAVNSNLNATRKRRELTQERLRRRREQMNVSLGAEERVCSTASVRARLSSACAQFCAVFAAPNHVLSVSDGEKPAIRETAGAHC